MAGATTTYENTETWTPRKLASSGRPGWIVAVSLATGLVAALVFAALPVVPVERERDHGHSPVRI